mgnify:CR=1 FL=1
MSEDIEQLLHGDGLIQDAQNNESDIRRQINTKKRRS